LKKKTYTTIFFDLDHTLWDYETNSKETLWELFHEHQLKDRGMPTFDVFHKTFNQVNEELWSLYDRGLIDSETIRQQRFQKILDPFEMNHPQLVEILSYEYLHNCPQKGALIPHAIEVLDYLQERYALSLITNGFEEIQTMKLKSGNITSYFDHVITSQKAGFKKPSREIFDFALSLHGSHAHESVMIGDNLLTDIAGAKNASVDTVFFNPAKKQHEEMVTHEIASLQELQTIL
jgi:YjjG family noncanonical pyrimidine nucleotidase